MNIGWVNPPEKISANIQIGTTSTARIGRPANKMETGGNNRASK